MLCLYLALFGSNISLVTMMMLGSIMAEYLPLLQEVLFLSFYPFGICQIQVSVGRLKTSCM